MTVLLWLGVGTLSQLISSLERGFPPLCACWSNLSYGLLRFIQPASSNGSPSFDQMTAEAQPCISRNEKEFIQECLFAPL
ncbi:hypothetical protein C8J56DRAFT_89944 [Mycena floridula]|nr:hypothetical protein C8J56DRAFT_89944 [Mycena floridula]